MIDQIGVDHVLQIAAPVIGEEDVDGFGTGVGAVRGDAMVDAVDDVGVRRKEGVRLHFFEGERDGLGAEGTADLLEGVECIVAGILDEVDIRESAL